MACATWLRRDYLLRYGITPDEPPCTCPDCPAPVHTLPETPGDARSTKETPGESIGLFPADGFPADGGQLGATA